MEERICTRCKKLLPFSIFIRGVMGDMVWLVNVKIVRRKKAMSIT